MNSSGVQCDNTQLLKALEEKEQYEAYLMTNQHNLAIATLDEAFAMWKKEQLHRRKRFTNQNGLAATLEKGYHIPFWQWWMNKLMSEQSRD